MLYERKGVLKFGTKSDSDCIKEKYRKNKFKYNGCLKITLQVKETQVSRDKKN